MKKKILTVVAHPDDEVLGAGGTLASRSDHGDEVYVLILADGENSRDDVAKGAIEGRQDAAKKAAAILGIKEVLFENFPDNQMDKLPLLEVIKKVEGHIRAIKPDVIYTHHHSDLNVDHRIVFEAVMTASRPVKGGFYPRKIYAFETLSSTEWAVSRNFVPNVYKNIEQTLERKIKALECYASEMRNAPHPRSYDVVRSLACLRGSEAALHAAEAFVCIRDIQGRE
jgi:N-acetylglucosamine malate deacetylase 1